ncbi:MAG: oxygen-independent coproporphyrinogen III oxidase [Lachnospiraceae bacterium]|nr:oxygen-independent coproporphyrinogen III oxidase [Candidatus Darwinimomas equi]
MTGKKLELYIHIPFCVRKCKYCDFLSAPAEEYIRDMYIRQLIEEISVQSQFYTDYVVSTIFFGGGTPSILKSVHVTNIMSAIYANWTVAANAEISLEANPGTLSQERLMNYRTAGINRLSIGLQSANNSELKVLGRIHTFEDFLESYETARNAGFDNINVDLISGVPGQTLTSWKNTVKRTAMLKPEHISAYSLIIEEGTEFHELYSSGEGKKLLPDEDTERDMYHETAGILSTYGYRRYEISNYAREGYECRHNTGYWTGEEYLGLGLGASSYTMGRRFHVDNDLNNYLHMDMHKDITPLYEDIQELTERDRISEFMILGLRMTKGVSAEEFAERFNRNMMEMFYYEFDKHVRSGLLEILPPYVRLTEKGLDLANVVMQDFV